MAVITQQGQRMSEPGGLHAITARLTRGLGFAVCILLTTSMSSAAALDELSLDRWKQLRETERYQLQIAEKYYREQNWKVAAAE